MIRLRLTALICLAIVAGCTLSATDAAKVAIASGARTVASASAALERADQSYLGALTDDVKAHPEKLADVKAKRVAWLARWSAASTTIALLDLAVAKAAAVLSLFAAGAASRQLLVAALEQITREVGTALTTVAAIGGTP